MIMELAQLVGHLMLCLQIVFVILSVLLILVGSLIQQVARILVSIALIGTVHVMPLIWTFAQGAKVQLSY
jgi:hypothetical protein